MRILIAFLSLLCAGLSMAGCEGDRGPAGPQGPPGTANVIYSEWFSPPTWDAYNEFGIAWRAYTMNTTLLTQEIVDHGVVLVYMRLIGLSPAIVQLPFVAPDVQLSFTFRARAGAVTALYYSLASPTTTPMNVPSQNLVRYVLIPGGVVDSTTAARGGTRDEAIAGLKTLSYDDARRLFDLPD